MARHHHPYFFVIPAQAGIQNLMAGTSII